MLLRLISVKRKEKVAAGYGGLEEKLFVVASYGKCGMESQGGEGNFW